MSLGWNEERLQKFVWTKRNRFAAMRDRGCWQYKYPPYDEQLWNGKDTQAWPSLISTRRGGAAAERLPSSHNFLGISNFLRAP